MSGFAIFGLLVYYFTEHYKPTRLIDSMLASLVSKMPVSLFFFDTRQQCIWANKPGMKLVGIENEEFHLASEYLEKMFGSLNHDEENWTDQHITGAGDSINSYVLEKQTVTDSDDRVIGSFLSVRDNSADQRALQNEMYKATHDNLTQVYNRSGYELLLSSIRMDTAYMLLFDVDYFKKVNDTYGHETGDRILQKVIDSVTSVFRSEDYVCRIGGDEFVVFMVSVNEEQKRLIKGKVRSINCKLTDIRDGLPEVSVSVGAAYGGNAKDQREWFDQADKALYKTKNTGRKGITFYDRSLENK